MTQLIEDLLSLSRLSRASLHREPVDMSEVARTVLAELRGREPERRVDTRVSDGLVVSADSGLLRLMLENLLGNAWKFTSKQPVGTIDVGEEEQGDEIAFFIRDNGAGFDMQYANQLFDAFQRLHSETEFEGSGIGLATVHRVVTRHGGRVWADSVPGLGATFFFTLGDRIPAGAVTEH